MFILQAKFSHDPQKRPCYISGAMSVADIDKADRFPTRAEAEARAEQTFPEPIVIEVS